MMPAVVAPKWRGRSSTQQRWLAMATDKSKMQDRRGHPSAGSSAAAARAGTNPNRPPDLMSPASEHSMRKRDEATDNVNVASGVADAAGDTAEGGRQRPAAGRGPRPLVAKGIRCYGVKGASPGLLLHFARLSDA